MPTRSYLAFLQLCLIVALVAAAPARKSQPACRSLTQARQATERGWAAYRRGEIALSASEFNRAVSLCPNDAAALTGAGYAAMRDGRLGAARTLFNKAIRADSASYDAVAGAGMAAYQAGNLTAARGSFERALQIVPRDSTALAYLARIPQPVSAASLPPRVRPQTMSMVARTRRRGFDVRNGAGAWSPLWIKAVNLGAALPGKHPSEFPPNDGTYERWISLIAEMGANAVRVYTIHPPHFYAALRNWNLAHPGKPVWLIHGVWTELPPGKKDQKYDDPKWVEQFRREMRHVASLIHGDAAIPPSPGHASGLYVADVSRWTLGYIIGREWEPHSVVAYNALHPGRGNYRGSYITVTDGNATEIWLARQCEFLVTYEMEKYNSQRPIAYTNWPTLDPLRHPTETTKAEEIRMLRARGERIVEAPKEYDNDTVAIDGVRMRGTAAFHAGVFASYHAYPYYPDFLFVDPGYARARSPEGPSSYFGYLRELIAHHGEMPVVISEYGVPSSRGIGHVHSQGWNHGGISEQQQAIVNARLTRDIYASGAAGAGLFALIDEWFKKSWVVTDFEFPADRKRLWLNVLDAEEHYGVVAMRPGRKGSAITIDGNGADWQGKPALYGITEPPPGLASPLQLRSLRVAQDEAFVYLRLDVGRIDWSRARYQIGIDTYRPDLGDTRMPNTGSLVPVGLEFVVHLGGPDASQVLVDHPYNLYQPVRIPGSTPPATQYVYSKHPRTVANTAGQWDSLVVVTNRRRIGRDGTIYPAISYNRNRLLHARQPQNSLADWFADPSTGVIEVRLPWGMLHVVDPSSRTVLNGNPILDKVAGAATEGFRFVVESYDPTRPRSVGDVLPRASGSLRLAVMPTWTWAKWEAPNWYAETKPQFESLRRAFAAIPDHPTAR